MARPCHVAGCTGEIPPVLSADGLCLRHFVEKVIVRADRVRTSCVNAEPADQEIVDWLLGDAREAAQELSTLKNEAADEQILEMLLCLANLQDYIAHHSVPIRKAN